MNLHEGIKMSGRLVITSRDAVTGEIVQRIDIKNMITFLAANVLVELLAQRATDPVPAQDSIFSMRMGSSNTPPSRSDENLGAFVIGVQLLDVNKVTGVPGSLQFTATLQTGDANGSTLQEAGLFTTGNAGTPTPSDTPGSSPGNPRLFARQIFPPVTKTSAITVELQWTIAFTA